MVEAVETMEKIGECHMCHGPIWSPKFWHRNSPPPLYHHCGYMARGSYRVLENGRADVQHYGGYIEARPR